MALGQGLNISMDNCDPEMSAWKGEAGDHLPDEAAGASRKRGFSQVPPE